MKILLIQDHLRSGGAARAAGRWVHLLKQKGWEARQVAGDEMPALGHRLTGKPPRGWGRVRELFGDRARKRKALVERGLAEILKMEKPDVAWFHNVAGGEKWGWGMEMLTAARQTCPVLWTLHDMWALGSGEESYWEVEEKKAGSGKGPGPRGKESRVESVCEAGGKFPVTLTAPSKWLADLTTQITGQRCTHLPNPIDPALFSPGDQREARRRLGLPERGLVVLAGADSLRDPRKGFDLLVEAWDRIRPKDATLALFGRHGEATPGHAYLGNLNSDEQMVAAYRAADLYVHPARMENAPCTIQESLACGTPVVAFRVGGIPEMVNDGRTGLLCASVSADALAGALQAALSDAGRLEEMRKSCRNQPANEGLEEKIRFLMQGATGTG